MNTTQRAVVEELYRNQMGTIRYFVSRWRIPYEDEEDFIHEVFFDVCRKIESYDESRGSMLNWIEGIVHYEALEYWRARRKRPDFIEDVEAIEDENNYFLAHMRRQAVQLIQELPDIYKEVLTLRFCNGLSYAEIAESLDIPEATVGTRIKRGREKLKAKMRTEKIIEY